MIAYFEVKLLHPRIENRFSSLMYAKVTLVPSSSVYGPFSNGSWKYTILKGWWMVMLFVRWVNFQTGKAWPFALITPTTLLQNVISKCEQSVCWGCCSFKIANESMHKGIFFSNCWILRWGRLLVCDIAKGMFIKCLFKCRSRLLLACNTTSRVCVHISAKRYKTSGKRISCHNCATIMKISVPRWTPNSCRICFSSSPSYMINWSWCVSL